MKIYHFTADWCNACEKLAPILAEFLEGKQNMDYAKINVDNQGLLAVENNVMSVPTLIIKLGDVEIKRHTGFANKETLKEFFNGI